MADPLYELLAPYFDDTGPSLSPRDPSTAAYLTRLSTLSFSDLTVNEPASLLHSAQSHLRNLQALSKRSHKAIISSSSHLGNLPSLLPIVGSEAHALSNGLPELESAASGFAEKYDRSTENAVLDRRKRAALLSRNVDRVSDVLDLPTLLSSTISAAQASSSGAITAASSATSYASALDIHAHVKRLNALYPQSGLMASISEQSDDEMQNMATILITNLQSPSLKLAGAMRTIGWLRRVAPELAEEDNRPSVLSTKSFGLSSNAFNNDGALGSLFLICRLHFLHETLGALDPLRDLADQESAQRGKHVAANGRLGPQPISTSALGSQSERYLKRYIEIYREQSFGILSMYKSVFPANLPEAEKSGNGESGTSAQAQEDLLLPLPSPIASFSLHLVGLLEDTLREYLPNVADKSARESLLTQVLYCAGSLGRLGADFGMVVALLDDDLDRAEEADEEPAEDPEWVQIMKKHRVQASRLEVLARGVGSGRKEVHSPQATSPAPSPMPA